MATKKPAVKKVIPKKPVPRKPPSMGAAVAKAMANDKPVKTAAVAEMVSEATSKKPKAALVVEPRRIKDEVSKPVPVKAPHPPEPHAKTISIHDLAQMASLTHGHVAAKEPAQAQDTQVVDNLRKHLVHDPVEAPKASTPPWESAATPDRAVESPLLKVDVPSDRKKPLDFNAVKEAMRKVNPFGR